MPLIKQERGRLDREDYFLTGSLTDFLGGGVCSRKDSIFTITKGEIKRRFPYGEFSAVLKLEPASGTVGKRRFFIETDQRKLGVVTTAAADQGSGYWRITCSDRFVQVFQSEDGMVWSNQGGQPLEEGEEISFLGFDVDGDATMCFSACTCFASPFLRIRNFPEDFTAKLLDTSDQVLKMEPFGPDMTVRIALDSPLTGKVCIYDLEGTMVLEGDQTDFEPGDGWLWTDYKLELYYQSKVIGYGPTTLDSQGVHKLVLKNTGTEPVTEVRLSVTGKDAAVVSLSGNGTEYKEQLTFETIAGEEEKSFYVKVAQQQSEFAVLDFQIELW